VICLPTPWDIVRIIRDTGQDPHKFLEFVTPEDIDEVDEFDPTWLYVGDKKFMMALRRYSDGCHFLDKKTKYCTIYESRPILCRLYPFKVTEFRDGSFKGFTLHKDVGCPRYRDGLMAVKPLYDLYMEDTIHTDDYEAMVKEFNAKDYPEKKPEDFIAMFYVKEAVKSRKILSKK
jgi:Fe-S-cluster containining protein